MFKDFRNRMGFFKTLRKEIRREGNYILFLKVLIFLVGVNKGFRGGSIFLRIIYNFKY